MELTNYCTDGKMSLLAIAAERHTAPSTILRLTAISQGKFEAGLAAVINGGNLGTPLPPGLILRVPAKT